MSGFGRDISCFIIIRRLSICASLVASREAGDRPSGGVSIIVDDPDETDPAGGASMPPRRVGIDLDIDVSSGFKTVGYYQGLPRQELVTLVLYNSVGNRCQGPYYVITIY